MKIGFLITARLKSTRLNLKLLLPLNGKTVIEHIIERAKVVIDCNDIVLCTSKLNQDLPLLRIAHENDIYYFNGHSEDVLQRLLDASLLFDLDYFVGITADNPLFSINHANLLVDTIKHDPSLDFVCTSGMPIGVNIYVMKVKALKTVCRIKEQVDTEIWGYLINRPEIFNVLEVKATEEYVRDGYRMTLDEYDDYKFFKALYNKFPAGSVVDVLDAYDILDSNPEIVALNKHVKQLDLGEDVKARIDNFYQNNKDKILDIKQTMYSKS